MTVLSRTRVLYSATLRCPPSRKTSSAVFTQAYAATGRRCLLRWHSTGGLERPESDTNDPSQTSESAGLAPKTPNGGFVVKDPIGPHFAFAFE